MSALAGLVIGYLIGGIPTGIWLCRAVKGVDPRTLGSGSSGATNVSRVLGKGWAVVVLLIDAAKGCLPVVLLSERLSSPQVSDVTTGVAIAAGTIVGHVYTPYANFRGGKGVATAAGALSALAPIPLSISLAVWLLIFAIRRTVSLASLAAAVALPIAALLTGTPSQVAMFAAALALFIVYTHRQNLARLLARTEKPVL